MSRYVWKRLSRVALALVAVSAGSGVLLWPSGCSAEDALSDGSTEAAANDAESSVSHDAARTPGDALSSDDAEAPCQPTVDSDGWQRLCGFENDECRFRVPHDHSVSFPPVAWTDCPERPELAGIGCARLVTGDEYVVTNDHEQDPPDAGVVSLFSLQGDRMRLRMVDLEGNTKVAIEGTKECSTDRIRVAGTHYTISVSHTRFINDPNARGGFFVGTFGEMPRFVGSYGTDLQESQLALPSFAVRSLATARTVDWTTLDETVAIPAFDGTPGTYQPAGYREVEGTLLGTAGQLPVSGVFAYPSNAAPIDLLAQVRRPDHSSVMYAAAADWMVWSETDRWSTAPSSTIPPRVALYAAPFTLNPTVLPATRKLLSARTGVNSFSQAQTACGYYVGNANPLSADYSEETGSELEIYRLGDGASAHLVGTQHEWLYNEPLLLTCTEATVLAADYPDGGVIRWNIVKIPLANLPFTTTDAGVVSGP